MLLGQSIVPLDGAKQLPLRFELLVRLLEEEVTLTPPGGFFPALEACGMMPTLDRWVVARAAAWWGERSDVANTVLNVNLSPETMDDPGFAEYVQEKLHEHRMPAAALCFELAVADVASASACFLGCVEKLKAAGCGIAVTGFGRDSMSLDALRMTGAPVVKMDGSLVRAVSEDPDAYSRVRSIHRLCSKAGVATVAEFVERPETLSKLREIGVDYAQGYGMARPEPFAVSGPVRTVPARSQPRQAGRLRARAA
jgi:EAL domain-containing protein (putative c-di-GMP-specific phosphodiesterase class I)